MLFTRVYSTCNFLLAFRKLWVDLWLNHSLFSVTSLSIPQPQQSPFPIEFCHLDPDETCWTPWSTSLTQMAQIITMHLAQGILTAPKAQNRTSRYHISSTRILIIKQVEGYSCPKRSAQQTWFNIPTTNTQTYNPTEVLNGPRYWLQTLQFLIFFLGLSWKERQINFIKSEKIS
jgi:hypothetical protein